MPAKTLLTISKRPEDKIEVGVFVIIIRFSIGLEQFHRLGNPQCYCFLLFTITFQHLLLFIFDDHPLVCCFFPLNQHIFTEATSSCTCVDFCNKFKFEFFVGIFPQRPFQCIFYACLCGVKNTKTKHATKTHRIINMHSDHFFNTKFENTYSCLANS